MAKITLDSRIEKQKIGSNILNLRNLLDLEEYITDIVNTLLPSSIGNIYNIDGTLTTSRILDGNNFDLTFDNIGIQTINANGYQLYSVIGDGTFWNINDKSVISNFPDNVFLLSDIDGETATIAARNLSADPQINLDVVASTGSSHIYMQDDFISLYSTNAGDVRLGGFTPGFAGTIGQVFTSQGIGTFPIWSDALNIYQSDSTLSGNRTVSMGGFNILFDGVGEIAINDDGLLSMDTLQLTGHPSGSLIPWKQFGLSNNNLTFEYGGSDLIQFTNNGSIVVGNGNYTFPALAPTAANQVLLSDSAGPSATLSWSSNIPNIYNEDGIVSANRLVDQEDKTLTFLYNNLTLENTVRYDNFGFYSKSQLLGPGAYTEIFSTPYAGISLVATNTATPDGCNVSITNSNIDIIRGSGVNSTTIQMPANGHIQFSIPAGSDFQLNADAGTIDKYITSQDPFNPPIWDYARPVRYETQASLPAANTHESGTLLSVSNDGANNGLYLAVGAPVGDPAVSLINISGGAGLMNVVEDTTPELGGDLDALANDINNLDTLMFNTSPTTALTEGGVQYDSVNKCLAVKNDEVDVTLQVGQENWIRVYNNSGATINNGQVVYTSGVELTEGRLTIALARADASNTSRVIGIATHNIENNTFGYVTQFGYVNDVDTSAFLDGESVWLSEITAGALTNIEPTSPNETVFIGFIAESDAVTGKIFITTLGNTGGSNTLSSDATQVIKNVRKASAGTINKGEAVYISGFNVGQDVIEVELADSSSPSTMPALGIANDTITNTITGQIIVNGRVANVDTSGFTINDSLYVSDSTPGLLTTTRPNGPSGVQAVARVTRVNASNGIITVIGAGRSNDVPNFSAADKYWYGDANGIPIEGDITSAGRAILDDTDAEAQRTTLGVECLTGGALGDETTDATTGIKFTYHMIHDGTIQDVLLSSVTGPTGSAAIIDVHKNGTTIFSTRPQIDDGDDNSSTSATPFVLSSSTFVKGDKFEFEIDQIGSTTAGAGYKVQISYIR